MFCKYLTCFIFSYCLLLPHLAWAQVSKASDNALQLDHLTGLLLTTPSNNEVAKSVYNKSLEVIKHKNITPEQFNLLKLSSHALNIHKIQTTFDHCLNNKARANNLGARIIDASIIAKSNNENCIYFNEPNETNSVNKLDQSLSKITENELKNLAIEESQKNYLTTYLYWDHRIKTDHAPLTPAEICDKIHCNANELKNFNHHGTEFLNLLPMKEQGKSPDEIALLKNPEDQLLRFTKAIDHKNVITKTHVLNAQNEIKILLEEQMQQVRSMTLADLVKTNPAAIGKILLDNPEFTSSICSTINNIADSEENTAKWNKVYVWGGLIVGGTLLVTGIGAGIGAVVLSETTMAATLVTVASVTAVAGTSLGIGDTIYSGHNYLNASHEALALRASIFSHNGDEQTSQEAKAKLSEAWSDLTSASISAISIIPFGSIWKAMSNSAKISRIGSLAKLEKISAEEQAIAIKDLGTTIGELKNPMLEKTLIDVQKKVSPEEYGSFIGQLSQLKPVQREYIISKMIEHPNKVKDAIEKGVKAGKEACL